MSPENTHSFLLPDVLNSFPDGVRIVDLDGVTTAWNLSAEALTGWKKEQIVGKKCSEGLLCHEDLDGNPLCDENICPLQRAISTGQSSSMPRILFAHKPNGARILLSVTVAPVRDPNGATVGGVESFRDLSPLLRDLQRARMIQDNAMEAELPVDSRVEFFVQSIPQEYVSGDLYRIESLDKDRYAVLLADVMGHGVASGLFAMQIRSLWEDGRDLLGDPARFARHLNERLCVLTQKDDFFATAFYGILDANTQRIRYVLAGHPSPFLVRNGGVTRLRTVAPALGLMSETQYAATNVSLQSGDRLVIYSDGAVEATDAAGNELGEEGLSDMITSDTNCVSRDGLSCLRQSLLTYTGRLQFEDDLTFVCMALL